MQTYTFHVFGMHCKACATVIESELNEVAEVESAAVSLAGHTVAVSGEFGDKKPEHIAMDLSETLKPHGYLLSLEKQRHGPRLSDFKIALPIATGFIGLFILLQKLGIVNIITISEIGYGAAFLLGLIASVSTCMAVVGGVALSLSANFAKAHDKIRPQALFHISRLVSFFVLGGVIGAIGAGFQLGATGTFVLSSLVAIVLIILGINLLDAFPWARKLQLTMPSFMAKKALGLKNLNHTLAPILVGIGTFFLPCGFTQSMQIYALSAGNFLTSALIMLSFALGTLPVLGALSFSSLSIHTKTQSSIFFKTAGIIVIFFGIFNLINGFVGAGIIPPLFSI